MTKKDIEKQTLLEVAKSFKTKGSYSRTVDKEVVELAVAWINGDITTGQAAKALGMNQKSSSSSALFQLCVALREGMKMGLITITYKQNA